MLITPSIIQNIGFLPKSIHLTYLLVEGRNLNVALGVNMLNCLRSQSLLSEAHVSSESAVRDPFRGVARCSLLKHAINLLERETLRLRDQEVRVHEADKAERSPDEEKLWAKIAIIRADQVGSDDSNDAFPQPVGGCGETDTAQSDGDGKDLADDDPGAGSPGGGKAEDVEADEGDQGSGGARVVGEGGAHCGDNKLTDHHADCAPDENSAATETLDSVEGYWCGADVDDGEDQRHEEGVIDGVERLEEDCGVVEDEIHASPLLHHSRVILVGFVVP